MICVKAGPPLLLLVLAVAPAQGQDKAASCQLNVLASLEMRTIPDGRVTVPVQLDGHEYQLMPDTGGLNNTVAPWVAQQLGYRSRQAPAGAMLAMGARRIDKYVTIKAIGLGRAQGKDFDFYVHDFDPSFYDGILAPQIMVNYDADFDFGHDKFNLMLPDHCPGKVVYWTGSPAAVVPMTIAPGSEHIRIPVMVDGKRINAILDTGADTSVVSVRSAKHFLEIDDSTPGAVKTPVAGEKTFTHAFKAMSFGSISVSNPRIEIVPDSDWQADEMVLGMGILRQLHMYVAYKERNLYLTPAMAK